MTIGPEPSTRILWRSSRLGMGSTSAGRPDRGLTGSPGIRPGILDLCDELVEQVQRVVRPRPRLRVVLDAAGRHVEQPDPLDRPVVEVDVRELGLAEVGLQPPAGLAADREAVVLRRDRDAPRAQVLDRVVAAAVREPELERLEPDGLGEQLVAEAD